MFNSVVGALDGVVSVGALRGARRGGRAGWGATM
jgi:hypothetical protein